VIALSAPSHPRCGVAFDVTVGVTNAGTLSTGHDFLVKVVDKYDTAEVGSAMASIPTLAAHATRTVTVHLTVSSHCGATHTLVATADQALPIDEIHEDDSVETVSYTLYPS
jgi:hypothetical protein